MSSRLPDVGVGNADGTLAMVFVNKVGDSIESLYEFEVVVESRIIIFVMTIN